MILRGDRKAIWTWYAVEHNMMEDDVEEHYDLDDYEPVSDTDSDFEDD